MESKSAALWRNFKGLWLYVASIFFVMAIILNLFIPYQIGLVFGVGLVFIIINVLLASFKVYDKINKPKQE